MKVGAFNLLSDILAGETKIVIPDLQRDYCWGTTNGLITSFTDSLIKAANTPVSEYSLGLLYAYEYPSNYFYLCDGQQRITSLYIILGVINSFEKDDKVEQLLKLGIDEPRLRYEVRNTTVYFLKELLHEVFLNLNSSSIETLENSNWWRDEYQNDPSIISICASVKSIYKAIRGSRETRNELRQFLLQKVGFVFFNLKINESDTHHSVVREFGEKMYEIVNTRGVPMEPNEHLKPLLLSKCSITEEEQMKWTETWECWQDFFWQHKGVHTDTADDGFNEFLRWIQIIESSISNKENEETSNPGTEDIKNLFKTEKVGFEKYTLPLIKQYVEALQWLISSGINYCKKTWLSPIPVEVEVQAPVKLTTLRRFKLTSAGRCKLTTIGRSKLTT